MFTTKINLTEDNSRVKLEIKSEEIDMFATFSPSEARTLAMSLLKHATFVDGMNTGIVNGQFAFFPSI